MLASRCRSAVNRGHTSEFQPGFHGVEASARIGTGRLHARSLTSGGLADTGDPYTEVPESIDEGIVFGLEPGRDPTEDS